MRTNVSTLASFSISILIGLTFLGPSHAAENTAFIRASAAHLVVDPQNRQVHLQGVNIDDQWILTQDQRWLLDDPHDEGTPVLHKFSDKDFTAIRAMGMNVVRENLNYRLFEDNAKPYVYKQSGWDWLDRRIAMARKHGLYVILSMMVPQGGYQPSGGAGALLWDTPRLKNRLKALWMAIARRYQNEPQIAGFDLLNEPNPTRSGHQWRTFSQDLINGIRTVDRNHLIIVEAVNWVVSKNGHSPESPDILAAQQFLVSDPLGNQNVMYDFHFYLPMSYTHQQVPWGSPEDGGAYPDPMRQENTYDAEGHYQQYFMARNQRYLEHEIAYFAAFGNRNQVPMNVGEWGTNPLTCVNAKGCFVYTADMLDSLQRHGLNHTFYTYDWIRMSSYEEFELLAAYPGAAERIRNTMRELFTKALRP